MPSDGLTRLDTPAAIELFRVKNYIAVYNRALEVTGTPGAAREIATRALDNAARRFAGRPLPADCDMYLTAQVYLLYAQQGPVLDGIPQAPTRSSERGGSPDTQASFESGESPARGPVVREIPDAAARLRNAPASDRTPEPAPPPVHENASLSDHALSGTDSWKVLGNVTNLRNDRVPLDPSAPGPDRAPTVDPAAAVNFQDSGRTQAMEAKTLRDPLASGRSARDTSAPSGSARTPTADMPSKAGSLPAMDAYSAHELPQRSVSDFASVSRVHEVSGRTPTANPGQRQSVGGQVSGTVFSHGGAAVAEQLEPMATEEWMPDSEPPRASFRTPGTDTKSASGHARASMPARDGTRLPKKAQEPRGIVAESKGERAAHPTATSATAGGTPGTASSVTASVTKGAGEPVPLAVNAEGVVRVAPEAEPGYSAASQTVYDKNLTEFWVPGMDGEAVPPFSEEGEAEPSDMDMNANDPGEGLPPDRPSAALSLFNAALVVICVVSLGFLLMELGLLPSIF